MSHYQCPKGSTQHGPSALHAAPARMASFLPVFGCRSGPSRVGLNNQAQPPLPGSFGSSAFSFNSQNLLGIWSHFPNPDCPVIRKVALTTGGSPFIIPVCLLDACTPPLCLCHKGAVGRCRSCQCRERGHPTQSFVFRHLAITLSLVCERGHSFACIRVSRIISGDLHICVPQTEARKRQVPAQLIPLWFIPPLHPLVTLSILSSTSPGWF